MSRTDTSHSIRRFLTRVAMAALPLLLVAQYVGNLGDHPVWGSAAYLTLFAACLWLPASFDPNGDRHTTGASVLARAGLLGALALLVQLAGGQTYQGLALFDHDSQLVEWLFWLSGASLVALAVALPKRGWVWGVGLVLPALALRAAGLDVWEIDPGVRDMLPLITSAHDTSLAGENPSRLHQMQQGSVVPLTYLPGMWLSYLPPRLVGLDIRWMGVLADTVVVASLGAVAWRSCRARSSGEPDGGESDANASSLTWAQAAFVAFAAVWLYLPSVHWNGIYAEPHVWWAVLAVLLASVALRRWWMAAVALGLAVTMRHFAVVVLPFVVLAMWRALGWRQLVSRLSVSGLIAAVLLVPFVACDPETFWFGTFRWLREYGPAHHTWFHAKFGFAGLFYQNAVADWLVAAQALSVGLCVAGAAFFAVARPAAGRRTFFGFAGFAYVLFIMFNGLIWYSFYLGAALFAAFAAVSAHRAARRRSPAAPVTGKAWYVTAAVFGLAVLAGGWLAWTLYQTSSRHGLTEVRALLEAELEPGDILVDRSDWRVEFVDGRPLFDGDDRPRRVRVQHEVIGRSTASLRRLFASSDGAGRLWMVERRALPRPAIDDVRRLGRVDVDETFGHFRVVAVSPHRLQARLADRLGDLEPYYAPSSDEPAVPMERDRPRAAASANNPWTAPDRPSWLRVAPKRCELGGGRFDMLYAHPIKTGRLGLSWEDVDLGQTLLLYGGVESPVVRWQRGDVSVDVRVDGRTVDTLELPNLPGPHWTAISTAEWGEQADHLELILTATDDAQRWTCVDGLVLANAASR